MQSAAIGPLCNFVPEQERCAADMGVSMLQTASFQDWMRIDAAERGAGERLGRPRVKMTCPQAMWDLIGSSDIAGIG